MKINEYSEELKSLQAKLEDPSYILLKNTQLQLLELQNLKKLLLHITR
jgi:hypothetical protein